MYYFVMTWDNKNNGKFSGPYDSFESAQEAAMNSGQFKHATNLSVVGPLPAVGIRQGTPVKMEHHEDE